MLDSSVTASREDATARVEEGDAGALVAELLRDRTARGLAFFEEHGGEFVEVAPNIVRVPSRSGDGFHDVDIEAESCPCPDYKHRTSKHEVGCAHVFGVAIARARRSAVRRAVPCGCCGGLFRSRVLVEVLAEHVDAGVLFAAGALVCRPCALAHEVL